MALGDDGSPIVVIEGALEGTPRPPRPGRGFAVPDSSLETMVDQYGNLYTDARAGVTANSLRLSALAGYLVGLTFLDQKTVTYRSYANVGPPAHLPPPAPDPCAVCGREITRGKPVERKGRRWCQRCYQRVARRGR